MFTDSLNGYATYLASGLFNFHANGSTRHRLGHAIALPAAYRAGKTDAETTVELFYDRGMTPYRAALRTRLAARRRARNRTRRNPRSTYGMQIRGRLPRLLG